MHGVLVLRIWRNGSLSIVHLWRLPFSRLSKRERESEILPSKCL
jgi:hypothetical protein